MLGEPENDVRFLTRAMRSTRGAHKAILVSNFPDQDHKNQHISISMKLSIKLSILAALVAGFVTAHAWIYTGFGSSGRASTYGGWTVYEDGWGAQRLPGASPLRQQCRPTSPPLGAGPAAARKSYPHAQANVDIPIGSGHWCTACFNFSAPNNRYGGVSSTMSWTASMQDELMIQEGSMERE